MPLNKRPSVNSGFSGPIGRQASADIFLLLSVSSPHQGKMRTRMGKLSCTVQYLFSSLGILVPSDPGFLSVRALEGLNLRI